MEASASTTPRRRDRWRWIVTFAATTLVVLFGVFTAFCSSGGSRDRLAERSGSGPLFVIGGSDGDAQSSRTTATTTAANTTTANTDAQTGNTPAANARVINTQTTNVQTTQRPAAPVVAVIANFAAAAQQNGRLQDELLWTFGGKAQRGWRLYAPLIAHLIGKDDEAATTESFAAALAGWQQQQGLTPSGVLDANTWSRMVATWQARRSTDHAYPSPEQLATVPAVGFYSTSRPEELRRVERQTLAAYKEMLRHAASDPQLRLAMTSAGDLSIGEMRLKIISAFRSREYQEQLRRRSPNAGRAGLALNSPHFTGRALDLYVGGDPVSTEDYNRLLQTSTPIYRWLVQNAERFGFRPYFYEPWHWEYQLPPPTPQPQSSTAK